MKQERLLSMQSLARFNKLHRMVAEFFRKASLSRGHEA
jgi:hypothetical protein